MSRPLPYLPMEIVIDAEAITEEIQETISHYASMPFRELLELLWQSFLKALPVLGLSLLFFLVGTILIQVFLRFTKQVLKGSRADATLHSFILSTIKIVLYVILIVTCVGILGVNFTPLIATLGAIGLAVSLAIQDILANIAGGFSLLLSRPFAKGDYVEIAGKTGTVSEIGIVYTVLKTIDAMIVHLPNGDVAKSTIINYTKEPIRRTDITFNIRETSDFEAVKAMMLQVLADHPKVLKDPAPILRFTDQTYRYVQLTAMVWAETPDLFPLRGELIGLIRQRIVEEGF